MKHYRLAKKSYRTRKKRSIFRNRFFWVSLLFLAVIGGLIYSLFISNIFEIKEIIITGTEKIQKADLENIVDGNNNRKIFFFLPANNLILTNTKEIKKEIINKFPIIENISVRRSWPDKLSLELKEREPFGVWCITEQPCFIIDKMGVIFQEISDFYPGSLVVKNFSGGPEQLGEKIIKEEKLESIFNIKKGLKDNSQIDIESFSVLDQERINAKTSLGWDIYFDFEGDLNWQSKELDLVLEKEIPAENRINLEYIDLRFSRVYYKYKE